MIKTLKQDLKGAQNDLETAETNSKKSLKLVKESEKEIHNLKKEGSKDKDDLINVVVELQELKAEVGREKKLQERNSKKKIKEDSMNNFKEESKVANLECDLCDFRIFSLSKFKMHMRIPHMGHCSTQTDEVVLKDVSVQSSKSVGDKNI